VWRVLVVVRGGGCHIYEEVPPPPPVAQHVAAHSEEVGQPRDRQWCEHPGCEGVGNNA